MSADVFDLRENRREVTPLRVAQITQPEIHPARRSDLINVLYHCPLGIDRPL